MSRYAVFKKLADGTPLWVSFEDSLPEAIRKITDLDRDTGLEHFVHDFHEEKTVATSR